MKALVFMTLLVLPPSPHPEDYAKAPVYAYVLPEVLARVGTFTHEKHEGMAILFCIADAPDAPFIHCVVKTDDDRLVLIDVEPSERAA